MHLFLVVLAKFPTVTLMEPAFHHMLIQEPVIEDERVWQLDWPSLLHADRSFQTAETQREEGNEQSLSAIKAGSPSLSIPCTKECLFRV